MLAEIAQTTELVIVDRVSRTDAFCSVGVDDVLGGRLAAEHLLELGHERIAFVGGPHTLGQVRDRLSGFTRQLAEAGRNPDDLTVIDIEALTVAQGHLAGQRIAGIPKARRPTAAFGANDLVALGMLQQCVAARVQVPGDLAIVGYDDIDFAAAAAVPLTSLRQPRHELGRRAAELLFDEVVNPAHQNERVSFTPTLVPRASTLGPRGDAASLAGRTSR